MGKVILAEILINCDNYPDDVEKQGSKLERIDYKIEITWDIDI